MSREETLRKVERDCASGDYGKARDRLHGLIATYADDLSLRARLGELYWQLHQPAMAGLYWYLEEDNSHAMEEARRAFEHRHGDNPAALLRALKFRGDLEAIRETAAGRTLLALQQRAQEAPVYRKKAGPGEEAATGRAEPDFRVGVIMLGCFFMLLVLVAIIIAGIIAVH